MRYIGLDLAWGEKNTTGGVVLDGPTDPKQGATLRAVADDLLTDADILAFVRAHDEPNDGLLIGVDAPLLVPNDTGRRPCEAILSTCLRKQEAGPHPANRTRLAALSHASNIQNPDAVRGERLVRLLEPLNIAHTPYLKGRAAPVRAVFEVFPHPAHIALFGLTKTLKYKTKPNRPLADRLDVFREYARLLLALQTADPPLYVPDEQSDWLARDPAELIKPLARLKRHEDALDALTCAYITLHRYRWGDEKCPVVGDLISGYIVTPADETTKHCFVDAAQAVRGVASPVVAIGENKTPQENLPA